MQALSGVYRPRQPKLTSFYRAIEDHFEPFEQVYPERYEREYGFWRPVVREVLLKDLDCGDRHQGFARLRCQQCGEESLLGFSCNVRYFCPRCHQRRVVDFAQWAEEEVLEPVPHRQYVCTLTKRLRVYFKYDRRLLGDLGRCGYESLKEFLQAVLPDSEATPGAVLAIQTFGELLNIHPHLHCVARDGGFDAEGNFDQLPSWLDMNRLAELFRHKVLRMLRSKGTITEALVDNLLSWPHAGCHVHQGERIEADDQAGRERVAAYILRAPLSQARMTSREETGAVIVLSGKKGKEKTVVNALDWLAALTAHIPDRGEQRVRYYGWYSNKSRGVRKKADQEDAQTPLVILPERSDKPHRLYWAQLIQQVYEVDPLVCPKCQGDMKIISFIEDPDVMRTILVHLGRWEIPPRAPPRHASPPKAEATYDYNFFDALVN